MEVIAPDTNDGPSQVTVAHGSVDTVVAGV